MLTTQHSLIRFFIACSLVAALGLMPEATPVWAADQVVNDVYLLVVIR
jgi:hypothetical protein